MREAERLGGFVDRFWRAFEFEDGADGSFVEVEMEGAEGEAGAEFLIAEGWAKAEGEESVDEFFGMAEGQFAFGTLLVAGTLFGFGISSCWGRRGFGGEDSSGAAGWLVGRGGGSFDAHAEQAASTAEGGVGCVEERILFEDSAVGDGGEPAKEGEDFGEAGDAQLDLDLGGSLFDFTNFAHGIL